MKSIKLFACGMIGLTSIGLVSISSCTKTFDEKAVVQTDFSNTAKVQVFVATVNAARNYLYVDTKPVNGAPMITGSLFPAVGPGFAATAGVHALLVRDTLSAATQLPLSFAGNFQANKQYTIFLYDTINAPKQKTVITDIVIPADSSARIRFANFVYNPTAVPAIDVYSFNKGANIFTNVAVTDVTNFISYPSRLTTPDTLYIRETGSTTNIIKFAMNLTFKRNYTLIYRGSHRGTRIATLFTNY